MKKILFLLSMALFAYSQVDAQVDQNGRTQNTYIKGNTDHVLNNAKEKLSTGGYWEAFSEYVLNGPVYALDIFQNDLYIGGYFTNAGDNAYADYIAKWNGTTWDSLGTGLDGWVNTIKHNGTAMVVGGHFDSAGGNMNARHIAVWNGTNWDALGTGINGTVNSIAISDSIVYAGSGGPSSSGRIYKWNGEVWDYFGDFVAGYGPPVYGEVIAFAMQGETVYAGGYFNWVDGMPIKNISQWNGTEWSSMGLGSISRVWAIKSADSIIYASGSFYTSPKDSAYRVAKWNGSAWTACGPSLNGDVYAIEISGNELFIGGYFTDAGGDTNADYLAKWNGDNWEAVGPKLNGTVWSIFASGDDLYVGGEFTMAGDLPASRVACWHADPIGTNDETSIISNLIDLSQNYPNPFNPSTTIKYELKQNAKVTLKIYNLLGQEVRTLVNRQQSNGIHSAVWDGKNDRGQMAGSGVYFYRLQAGDFVKTRKMVLVK